jgi:hypothetical protein
VEAPTSNDSTCAIQYRPKGRSLGRHDLVQRKECVCDFLFASGCPEDPAVQLIGHAVKKKWVNGRRWCEVERRTLIDINLSEWCLCRYN